LRRDAAPRGSCRLALRDALPIYEAEPLEPSQVRGHLSAGAEIRDARVELRPLALPAGERGEDRVVSGRRLEVPLDPPGGQVGERDRKSTRLNSSHVKNSHAVLCL